MKKLKDFDIIEQFEIVGSDVDESRSESCVCGKDQLKYLYYIKNKKLRENEDDFVEYATTTLIIGNFKWFHEKKLQIKKICYFRLRMYQALVFNKAQSQKRQKQDCQTNRVRIYEIPGKRCHW